jgi:hypothetical protein
MWEDFMRGNWPAAASAAPTPTELPSATSSVRYPRPSARAETAAMARAEAAPRPVAGRFTVRAALAAGAGLVLAVVAPASAVAGGVHITGAHAHIAAHGATSP